MSSLQKLVEIICHSKTKICVNYHPQLNGTLAFTLTPATERTQGPLWATFPIKWTQAFDPDTYFIDMLINCVAVRPPEQTASLCFDIIKCQVGGIHINCNGNMSLAIWGESRALSFDQTVKCAMYKPLTIVSSIYIDRPSMYKNICPALLLIRHLRTVKVDMFQFVCLKLTNTFKTQNFIILISL